MAGVLPDLGDCHGRLRLPRNDTEIYRSPSNGTLNYNLPQLIVVYPAVKI
jgi:hypothetical protein